MMHPTIIATLRAAHADWEREAHGSRTQQAYHERIAGEHRADAERAERMAADIEGAMREAGVTP